MALVHPGLAALAEEALVAEGAKADPVAQERMAVLIEDGNAGDIEAHCPRRARSELPEVMLLLEGRVFLAEGRPLRPLHREERAREERPERAREHSVAFQMLEGLRQRGGESHDATGGALRVGVVGGIDHGRLPRLELSRDAVEPGREQSAELQK